MIKISHFKLGLFFVVCVGLGLGILFWIGASDLFKHKKTYVTFFNVSVEGLGEGSAVHYLGLKVGEVVSIKLAPDGKLIMVLLQMQPDFRVEKTMAVSPELPGLAGKRSLTIGKAPPDIKSVTPVIGFPVSYPVIPSHPGEMHKIASELHKIESRIEHVDIEGLVAAWKETAQSVNRILLEKDLPQTLHNARNASSDLQSMIADLKKSGVTEDLRRGAGDFAETAAQARKSGAYLKKQIEAIPPGAFAHFAERMDRLAGKGEFAVSSMKVQMEESLTLLQQTLFRTNQVIRDAQELVNSLREEPGRVIVVPKKNEPFKR
jgi:phospholipid/cholesterol/gamma-HCH transport system substrate-binding protein